MQLITNQKSMLTKALAIQGTCKTTGSDPTLQSGAPNRNGQQFRDGQQSRITPVSVWCEGSITGRPLTFTTAESQNVCSVSPSTSIV